MTKFIICNQIKSNSNIVFRSSPIENVEYVNGDGLGNNSLYATWVSRCKYMDIDYPSHRHWVELLD